MTKFVAFRNNFYLTWTFFFLLCSFDYGEKFWVIKHKFFTCHCASEKCRYSRTNITSFLREYYKRSGEPLPPELQTPTTETNGTLKVDTDSVNKKSSKKDKSPTVVIPLTKVNVKALQGSENPPPNANKVKTALDTVNKAPENSSSTPARPRRSVTRKSAASEAAETK